MEQIHLLECPSTQTALKEKIEQNPSIDRPLLVSAQRQTQGRGRGERRWVQTDNALAFSLTLKPHEKPTLTPLEIASILTGYFRKQGYRLHLKWPNDILNSKGQKCGGILCTLLSEEILIAGIGLNLGQSRFEGVPHKFIAPGSVDEKRVLGRQDKKEMPLALSRYLMENRMSSKQVIDTWNYYCFHQDKKVIIADRKQKISGFFRGITTLGEAILENNGHQEYATTGSLLIDEHP